MSLPARFVHIGFNLQDQAPSNKDLEGIFNTAIDWLRYDSHCWILYTTTELDTWRDRIRKVFDAKAEAILPGEPKPKTPTFLLFEIDVNERSGWAYQWIWDWLSKNR